LINKKSNVFLSSTVIKVKINADRHM